MALQRIPSLLLDEILSRLFTRIRKRAARKSIFSGIVVPVDDLIGRRIMATGMFEATQIEGITQLLERPELFSLNTKPAGVFVDVGANIGLFTIAFSRFFDRTLAIEANPQTFAILQANTTLRDLGNVKCLCLAASDSAKSSTLFVPNDGNLGHATMSLNQHRSSKKISIECRPLDQIVDENGGGIPIGLIKIDVEGHELEVLKGARNTLLRDRPIVLFEALNIPDATKCAELLYDCGYTRLFSFRRGRKGSRVVEILTGFTRGLDVYARQTTPKTLRKSPLICATP